MCNNQLDIKCTSEPSSQVIRNECTSSSICKCVLQSVLCSPDVEHDGPLHPGDHEVGALADDVLLDAGEAVEDDGAVAAVHVEQGRLHHAARHRQPHAQLAQPVEDLSHANAHNDEAPGIIIGSVSRLSSLTNRVISNSFQFSLN